MNLNIKKVSVPVLMFLMAQSGFGVSNANFGNANRALGQRNLNRAVRCLTDEAIKKDEASGGNDHAELKKLLVNKDESTLQTTINKIGAMLKEVYIEYAVPRDSIAAKAVRTALKDIKKADLTDDKITSIVVDKGLFAKYNSGGEEDNGNGKYLWWTIDGYDNPADGIKGKFNQVVDQILNKTENKDNWKDINPTGEDAEAQANRKTDADLLMGAIANKIAGLTADDFEGEGWWTYDEQQPAGHTAAGENWTSVLTAISSIVSSIDGNRGANKTRSEEATHEQKESIIDALQVFLGDRLMDKLINPETKDKEGALKNFFRGHFMREVAEVEEEQDISKTSFKNALREVSDIMSDAAGDDNDKKERIYNVTFDAIFDTIEGLLRSKDAPVSIDMFKDGGIYSDTFKKTLVNLLDNLALNDQGKRTWSNIENTDLKKQLKRLVWIDNDDDDVAEESDNESYDYDLSGGSDEEQAERAEEAVTKGLESADKLIPQP